MKFRQLVLSLLLVPTLAVGNEANDSLRATIQKWVAVMKETQSKQQEWREQKQILKDSKSSLQAEAEQIAAEIKLAEERLAKADELSSDKLKRQDEFNAAREALRTGLDALEMKVSAVIPLLPGELLKRGKVDKAVADHRKYVETEDQSKLGLNARLTAMLTILTEAEKFNQVVTPFEGRAVEAGGQTVILDGAYFGLAFGFAADESGSVAIRLSPGPNGWQENLITEKDEVAAIRALINVANGSGDPSLVNVPVKLVQ